MAKQYKPGQFIWVYGKKHKVTKAPSMKTCDYCPYKAGRICIKCVKLLTTDCYPKPV